MAMSHHYHKDYHHRMHMGSSYEDQDDDNSMRHDDSRGGSREPEVHEVIEHEDDDEDLECHQEMPTIEPGEPTSSGRANKKPKMRKRPGRPLKDFFEFGYDGEGVKFGVCKICREKLPNILIRIKMTNSNTSGIQKHLLSEHKAEYYEVNPLKKTEDSMRYEKNDYGFQIGLDNVETSIGPCELDEAIVAVKEFEAHLASASSPGRRSRGASSKLSRLRPRRATKRLHSLSFDTSPVSHGETFEQFGAFVAAELRSLENKECQKKLKLVIQKCIIQAAEEDMLIKKCANNSDATNSNDETSSFKPMRGT